MEGANQVATKVKTMCALLVKIVNVGW